MFRLSGNPQTADLGVAHANGHAGWIGNSVLRFDRFLQRRHGVIEYSTDVSCVFRIQDDIADQDLVLSDGTVVAVGDRIVTMHLWNEHVPPIPPSGPTIGWACRLAHAMQYSMHLLREYLSNHPEFAGITAFQFHLMVATRRKTPNILSIMRLCGFEHICGNGQVPWTERLWRYGENVTSLMLCIAVNPRAARLDVLWRTRSHVVLSRRTLDRRYGNLSAAD